MTTTYKTYLDARFEGHKGSYSISGQRGPEVDADFADSGRLLALTFDGKTYWAPGHGANPLGGPHSTAEWTTFAIAGFRAEDGTRLKDVLDATQLTLRCPQPAPCFGPDTTIPIYKNADPFSAIETIPFKDLRAGMLVRTESGPRVALWVGGGVHRVVRNNAPILWQGQIYSPQHRIRLEGRWTNCRKLLRAGLAELAPHDGTQWYGHVLLHDHCSIDGAESLLPTERALSGMDDDTRESIQRIMVSRDMPIATPLPKDEEWTGQETIAIARKMRGTYQDQPRPPVLHVGLTSYIGEDAIRTFEGLQGRLA